MSWISDIHPSVAIGIVVLIGDVRRRGDCSAIIG